jgi:signal transduction histidine kinase
MGVIAYVALGQLTHYIPNPMLPQASLALNMIVPVVIGYWDGAVSGAITGALGTLLNFLLKIPFYNVDTYELLALAPHTLMGALAGWRGFRGLRVSAALTVFVGHALNLAVYGAVGLISIEAVLSTSFWLGLMAEIMINLILIVLIITLLERLQGRSVGFAWRHLGPIRFLLLATLNLVLVFSLLIAYQNGIPYIDYVLIMAVVIIALTLGFMEAWISALLISLWVGRVVVNRGLSVTDGIREVVLILVINTVALVIGNVVSNLRRQRRLNDLRLEELQEAYTVLSQADRFKDQMIQNISHELRTPLSMILGYTELLSTGTWGDLTPEQSKAAHVMRRNARQLSEIVEKVTVLKQVDQGQATRHPTSLVALAKNLLNSWRKKPIVRQHRLQLDVSGKIPPVNGDASYLNLAIEALLENAVKFSPEGGTIISRIWSDSEKVYFAVIDQGIGITDENQPHLFEPFYQIDGTTTRRFNGLGTGLAMVKEVARIHQGDVWVESEVGKGSTFGFWIPGITKAAAWKQGNPRVEKTYID